MTEQRDRIAQSMAEAAGSMCFRQAGAEWEHLRSVWRGHADAALVVISRDVEQLRGRTEKAERAVDLLAGSHRRAEQLEAAIARVRDLHQSVQHMGQIWCGECSVRRRTGPKTEEWVAFIPHPCATIRALNEPAEQSEEEEA